MFPKWRWQKRMEWVLNFERFSVQTMGHISDLSNCNKSLQENQSVEFTVTAGPKGPQAQDITIL